MTTLTSVILAGGLGSRYGGLKQIDPMGPHGETILDYTVFDAVRAGFESVVLVINPQMRSLIAQVGDRLARHVDLKYADQTLDDLPAGFRVPPGRVKPWGTAHAVMAAAPYVDGPFAVFNADDFYGSTAIESIGEFLRREPEPGRVQHLGMVGYPVVNTVTEYGTVARGVCQVDAQSRLVNIVERTSIEKTATGARHTSDEGQTWTDLAGSTLVSMNLWGLTHQFLDGLSAQFAEFLMHNLPTNPDRCEFFLPSVVQSLMDAGQADVTVIPTTEQWHGVTYRSDRDDVVRALAAAHERGVYPPRLWGEDHE
ncbi:MAG: NTP transferase domain-containing protein [Propionibacteriaceae bacterium]|nr:NTP transferase domain-containing protein [Propionibacteriaceae bacterium]